jgi:hypothetical protein
LYINQDKKVATEHHNFDFMVDNGALNPQEPIVNGKLPDNAAPLGHLPSGELIYGGMAKYELKKHHCDGAGIIYQHSPSIAYYNHEHSVKNESSTTVMSCK